jgi:hypothetical protein
MLKTLLYIYYVYDIILNKALSKILYWQFIYLLLHAWIKIMLLIKYLQRFNMNIVIYILNLLNVNLYLIDNIYLLMIKSYSLLFTTKEFLNIQDKFNNINKLID